MVIPAKFSLNCFTMGMVILVLTAAGAVLGRAESGPVPPLSSGGTLVLMVPSNNGLVVAADSRTTVVGVNCDGQFKIREPTHPSRTIVTVTGVGTILDAPSQPVPLLAPSPM